MASVSAFAPMDLKPSVSDLTELQRRNDHRLPKSPGELKRRDPPNRMDLSPLSRLCFGCKLFPMKTIAFILLLSLSARAEEQVCKTVAECLYLQGRVESQLEELRKHPPTPQDKPAPTDNSNRVPQAMTHDEAIDYCKGFGGRLPTALELAQLAIKQGGKNIAQPSDKHDLSYKPVDARNPDGSLDHFLFSYQNYPYGALTHGSPASRIWSSSTWSAGADPEPSYFYALRDGEGYFVPDKKDNQYAVFCVR